jgi:hypothetical protein
LINYSPDVSFWSIICFQRLNYIFTHRSLCMLVAEKTTWDMSYPNFWPKVPHSCAVWPWLVFDFLVKNSAERYFKIPHFVPIQAFFSLYLFIISLFIFIFYFHLLFFLFLSLSFIFIIIIIIFIFRSYFLFIFIVKNIKKKNKVSIG